jgi:hypothetical protein
MVTNSFGKNISCSQWEALSCIQSDLNFFLCGGRGTLRIFLGEGKEKYITQHAK